MLSDVKKSHERRAYTLLILLGDIGGFNEAIKLLPSLFMGLYASNMFQLMVSKLARFRG